MVPGGRGLSIRRIEKLCPARNILRRETLEWIEVAGGVDRRRRHQVNRIVGSWPARAKQQTPTRENQPLCFSKHLQCP